MLANQWTVRPSFGLPNWASSWPDGAPLGAQTGPSLGPSQGPIESYFGPCLKQFLGPSLTKYEHDLAHSRASLDIILSQFFCVSCTNFAELG